MLYYKIPKFLICILICAHLYLHRIDTGGLQDKLKGVFIAFYYVHVNYIDCTLKRYEEMVVSKAYTKNIYVGKLEKFK